MGVCGSKHHGDDNSSPSRPLTIDVETNDKVVAIDVLTKSTIDKCSGDNVDGILNEKAITSTATTPSPPLSTSTNKEVKERRNFLVLLPSSVITHVLFPMLDDGDAMNYLVVDKQTFYQFTPTYRIKLPLKMWDLLNKANSKYRSFRSRSTFPIPIVNSLMDVHNLDNLDKLRILRDEIHNMRIRIFKKDSLDWNKVPLKLQELFIDSLFVEDMIPRCFPPELKKLEIFFVEPKLDLFEPDIFPSSLRELRLTAHTSAGQLQPNVFPTQLKSLYTDILFSTQSLERDLLPSFLEVLHIDGKFNSGIDENVLPATLRSLILGDSYQQLIRPGVLPASLTMLKLGKSYKHPFHAGVLPLTLESLSLGSAFNHPILPGILPPSLKNLTLGRDYSHPFPSLSLPSSLQELHLEEVQANLTFESNSLPSSLQILGLPVGFSNTLSTCVLAELPLLQKIIFPCPYLLSTLESKLLPHPETLKCFILLGNSRDQQLKSHSLPNTLEELRLICSDKYHPLSGGIFPRCLKSLVLDGVEDVKPHALPPTLEKLVLLQSKPTLLSGSLPDSLKILELGYWYIDEIEILPRGLQHLYFKSPYPHYFKSSTLPPDLQIHSQYTDTKGYAHFTKRPYQYIRE